jgi:hypothetical protein
MAREKQIKRSVNEPLAALSDMIERSVPETEQRVARGLAGPRFKKTGKS